MPTQTIERTLSLSIQDIAYILAGLYLLEEHAERDAPIGQRAWNVLEELETNLYATDAIEELRERVNGE